MIRKIQILGTRVTITNEIAQRVDLAAKQLGIECEIEQVTDIRRIMCFGPRLTPAVYIDGDIRAAGETPTAQEFVEMLDTPTHHRVASVSEKAHIRPEATARAKSNT